MLKNRYFALGTLDESGTNYLLQVLAHGGCNTFPSRKGSCTGCGAEVFYDSHLAFGDKVVRCPGCGGVVEETGNQHFGEFTDLTRDWCDFLRDAARR